MSQFQNHTLSTKKLLTVFVKVLHTAFVEASRTEAKKVFSILNDGRTAALITLDMEDESRVDIELVLNGSEYCGRLNFSSFRNGLGALLAKLAEAVGAEAAIPTLSNDSETVFNIPAGIVDGAVVNVLMLSFDQSRPGTMRLNLMFVDPEQFKVDSTD